MFSKIKWIFCFIALMWIFAIIDLLIIDINRYGILPRSLIGFFGIFTATFLHADLDIMSNHLLNNSLFLLFLLPVMLFFYQRESKKVIFFIFLLEGFLVWLFARGSSIHIGASGLIFGLLTFIFLSGFINRQPLSIIGSLLLFFLYSIIIYGFVPNSFSEFFIVFKGILKDFIRGVVPDNPYISWEAHLFGAISGIIATFYFRRKKLE